MKHRFFSRVVANLGIVFVLVLVGVTTFAGGTLAVNGKPDNRAVYRGNTDSKNISLMINVYWGTEFLPGMLDTLSQKGVKCTFFIGGMWAAENDKLLNRMVIEGHELGNHGYHHKECSKVSVARNREEITVTEQVVEKITGVKTRLFAPPGGDYNTATLKLVEELGYKTILWTADTIDWRDHDADLIYRRATKNPTGGNLILMHPTEATARALPKIIDNLQDAGYTLTIVSDTLSGR